MSRTTSSNEASTGVLSSDELAFFRRLHRLGGLAHTILYRNVNDGWQVLPSDFRRANLFASGMVTDARQRRGFSRRLSTTSALELSV